MSLPITCHKRCESRALELMLRVATFLFRAIVLFPSTIILIPAGHPIFHPGFFQYRESPRVQRIAIVSTISSCSRSPLLPFGSRCSQRQHRINPEQSALKPNSALCFFVIIIPSPTHSYYFTGSLTRTDIRLPTNLGQHPAVRVSGFSSMHKLSNPSVLAKRYPRFLMSFPWSKKIALSRNLLQQVIAKKN